MPNEPHDDPIDAALLAARIREQRAASPDVTGPIGRRIEHHARIDSTSDRARAMAASGEPEGTVVFADEQTAGRGRAERQWHSPPGPGLYFSVILRPDAAPAAAPIFGLMTSVACCEALRELCSIPIRIKWPNDLVVDEGDARKKLAGILAEARTTSESIRDLVIGVGVNVNHRQDDFPPVIAARSTSLRIAAGRPFPRALVAARILTRLDVWYTLWNRHGNEPILESYAGAAPGLVGQAVRVVGAAPQGAAVTGTTAGLDADGALLVAPVGGGENLVIRYGEVLRLEDP